MLAGVHSEQWEGAAPQVQVEWGPELPNQCHLLFQILWDDDGQQTYFSLRRWSPVSNRKSLTMPACLTVWEPYSYHLTSQGTPSPGQHQGGQTEWGKHDSTFNTDTKLWKLKRSCLELSKCPNFVFFSGTEKNLRQREMRRALLADWHWLSLLH